MVAAKAVSHRKREYVIIKFAQTYYYARLNPNDPDMYIIQVRVQEQEGREIIKKANEGSQFNKEVDRAEEP